jgi:hypothetical protein
MTPSMETQVEYEVIEETAASPFDAYKRRIVGGIYWRDRLQEAIELERSTLADLRAIKDKHHTHLATQQLVANVALAAAERMGMLNELLQYQSKEEPNGSNGNGGDKCSTS